MINRAKYKIMRNSKILLKLLIISLILFACEKEDDNKSLQQESSDFIFKAEKDNESWVATNAWGYFNKMDSGYTLSGAMEDPNYFQEEDLNIFIEQEKIVIGEKLRDFDARLSFIIGGDGVAWRYEKTESFKESYIIINELDTVNNRISGEFEIRLQDARSSQDYYINMTNGEFSLTYEDTDTY